MQLDNKMNTIREETQGYIKHRGKNIPITVIFKSDKPSEEQRQNAKRHVEQFCTQAGKQLFNYMEKYNTQTREQNKDDQDPSNSSQE